MVQSISETLGVEKEIARALLLKYQWNAETLIQDYYDKENILRRIFNVDDLHQAIKKA